MSDIGELYENLLYNQVAFDFFAGRRQDHFPNSDILLHLPLLRYYAGRSESVVEFGVRGGQSTVALMAGLKDQPVLRWMFSFDVDRTPFVDSFGEIAGPGWEFRQMSTVDESVAHLVPEADLFFFDTLHTDRQIREELRLHGHKARKYLVFHDTTTCGEFDLSGPNPREKGIRGGIFEYAVSHNWVEVYNTKACNGLLILAKNV